MNQSLSIDEKDDIECKVKVLPPRQNRVHKRTLSDGANSLGFDRVLAGFTARPTARTRASTVEEEREKFHNRNQKFLKSVPKRPNRPESSLLRQNNNGSFRDSPRKAISLASIGNDDWEREDDSSIEGSDAPHNQSFGYIDLKGMYVVNSEERSQLSASTADLVHDESSCETFFSEDPTGQNFEQNFGIDGSERKPQLETNVNGNLSDLPTFDIAETPREEQQFIRQYAQELEKERESLIKQWRAEFEAELAAAASHDQQESRLFDETFLKHCRQSIFNVYATLEVFICNMPLTIAASALSWATLGVVWFKFGAEHLILRGQCKQVHFYDPHNTYPHEFPGSFSCDKTPTYLALLYFHFGCHIFAAIIASFFLLKVCLAWRVVSDDLTNPVTATPVGVMCITLEIVFAAGGTAGALGVLVVSVFHGLFAFWYLYVAVVKFRLLPDPSWFPGMVGLAYAAVKTWLLSNVLGKVFLGVSSALSMRRRMLFTGLGSITHHLHSQLCLSFFFGLFFISVIRVALNKKIAAPVCWLQLSAPSIALYACTIMSQPTVDEERVLEESAIANHLYHVQMKEYYLPFQHGMFALCLAGMVSSLHSLWMRWDLLKQKEFSPAHLAFCFPTLSHANAVQAYRASINAFSTMPASSPFRRFVYIYWITCLLVGSVVNLIFTYKALVRLPKWTNISIAGEDEPPKPSNTIMFEMLQDAREVIDQPFVSPAVLQANETGSLIRVRRGTEDYRRHGPYVRTRHVASFGFDPTLSSAELRDERARLLDWVARQAPRTRKRTLSIPVFLKLEDSQGKGIYGSFDGGEPPDQGHRRSQTMSDLF
jgi:hypothetical protein